MAQDDGSSVPKDNETLLQRIREQRDSLERVVRGLNEAQMTWRPSEDAWSVKDHLAHIWAWLKEVNGVVAGLPPYEGLGIEKQTYRTADVDKINEILYRRNRDMPLQQVMFNFRQEHGELLDFIERTRYEDLLRPYNPADPGDTRTVMDAIIANSYDHDAEHEAWIRELLAREPKDLGAEAGA